ncbi:hypothetical protein CEP10_18290 [Cylindrospermopsis raciborskii S07]|uniref:Uncharacterized protein n=2 Tax=Cylindrospermopsis raciborskii TaxID=77022 RepID=A0A853MD95_9CYAN|nr:hypothetical protein [Cylindrospermopsis raciborskii]KRH96014.1 hypothetical protein ASL19_08850 [Cylindrospermopsis sp. CR12]OBU75276.1 hypothetical protein A9P98_02335 [Cylindrospermopsis raciborskii CS-505]OHY35087.1 hypothetical protein BCV63_02835 [Cylindrospermopsis raciborskii CS-508]PNJ91442.1 hypothetical protein CEP15_18175 [Cylindrospermopsis raciborskii C07]PNJ91714.1 hypothetical protein CEP13_16705 [Cylindrospermopsis raciborskii C03]PNJ96387.1 hypothetical protein CEP14_0787
MSDCTLFPASPSSYRVWSVWADRESHLSLADGTFTHIQLRVQPSSTCLLLVEVGEVITD